VVPCGDSTVGNSQYAINRPSIRPSTNHIEPAPITSVFYDVIHLAAIRGGSNAPIEGHFWQFILKIWTPKCCRSSYGPTKGTSLRHNACFEQSCV